MLSRYRRSQPHFIRNLSIDVFLLVAIGLIGFQFVNSRILTTNPSEDSRVIAMTPDKLIALVTKHKDSVYWLGSMPGNKYSFNQSTDDVDLVTYLPTGSSLSNVNQRKMTVKTYKTFEAYSTHIHPLVGANAAKLVTAKGNTVEFDEALMDVETVTLSGGPEIVVIRYPTMQTAETIIKNADRLELIR